ncbi:hypothetical protein K449DRAFT_129680 [Hypoxylon sp. EC38]|nr:hypothetical protein K449DRAFT_129680 [Hypoxylon sp. EC38]
MQSLRHVAMMIFNAIARQIRAATARFTPSSQLSAIYSTIVRALARRSAYMTRKLHIFPSCRCTHCRCPCKVYTSKLRKYPVMYP